MSHKTKAGKETAMPPTKGDRGHGRRGKKVREEEAGQQQKKEGKTSRMPNTKGNQL